MSRRRRFKPRACDMWTGSAERWRPCLRRLAALYLGRQESAPCRTRRDARRSASDSRSRPVGHHAGSSKEAAAAPAAPTFTLLLVNDIYRMGDDKGRGGFAKLAAVVKEERARGVPMLFCHAGDTFSPSLMSGFDQGAHIVELTNMIRPDVFVPGNHEFDFGTDVYFKRMRANRTSPTSPPTCARPTARRCRA